MISDKMPLEARREYRKWRFLMDRSRMPDFYKYQNNEIKTIIDSIFEKSTDLEGFARTIMSMKSALNNPDAFDKWVKNEEIEFKKPPTQEAKNGGGEAGMPGGGFRYEFQGDPRNIFAQFFDGGAGGGDPFSGMFELRNGTGMDDMHGGGDVKKADQRQDPAVQYELAVTLENINKGCNKKMKITRKVLNPDGQSTRTEDKTVTIKIKPGCKSDTEIIFPKEGDQHPGRVPADIVFVIKDKLHPKFKREGQDIRYVHRISAKDAFCGTTISVPTLDGSNYSLPLVDVVKPGTIKRLPHMGLPNPKNPSVRGDLIVEFDIQFPSTVNSTQKELIRNALS
ncbi:hypothetical protein WR25_22208 [Diploscapter pachys]|uniref:Chaperone DnaJ C-terminal domain-containing protein n=1 Tax=Diploscapter pachys TaxID=2018661 RepID=A0A2A2KXD2_9BILA|nr:hypothetical protein WR25_22208 [Diploscapter pachys]